MKLSRNEFDLLRKRIYSLCGLTISDGKEYLIEHRLKPLLMDRRCRSWKEFYKLFDSGDVSFREDVVCAISTHETSFFRDNSPFSFIKNKVLPDLLKKRKNNQKIRIWSAAASTGQEAYSLSMIIHELAETGQLRGVRPQDFSILATDISRSVLARAQEGVFSELEISRGLPESYSRYFQRQGRSWVLNRAVRSIVSFKKFNLLNSFSSLGRFDFVLCRNVLIYFDDATKIDIVHRIHSLLPEYGYLMLGATESLAGQTDRFVPEHAGSVFLYRKSPACDQK